MFLLRGMDRDRREGVERRDQEHLVCLERITRGVDTTTGSPRGNATYLAAKG